MKLVTFSVRGGNRRSGALIDDGKTDVDLAAASQAKGRGTDRLATVLAIAEGGQGALDEAYDTVKGAAKDAVHARGGRIDADGDRSRDGAGEPASAGTGRRNRAPASGA